MRQRFRTEAEALGNAGTPAFDNNIGSQDQVGRELPPLVILQVDAYSSSSMTVERVELMR